MNKHIVIKIQDDKYLDDLVEGLIFGYGYSVDYDKKSSTLEIPINESEVEKTTNDGLEITIKSVDRKVSYDHRKKVALSLVRQGYTTYESGLTLEDNDAICFIKN